MVPYFAKSWITNITPQAFQNSFLGKFEGEGRLENNGGPASLASLWRTTISVLIAAQIFYFLFFVNTSLRVGGVNHAVG